MESGGHRITGNCSWSCMNRRAATFPRVTPAPNTTLESVLSWNSRPPGSRESVFGSESVQDPRHQTQLRHQAVRYQLFTVFRPQNFFPQYYSRGKSSTETPQQSRGLGILGRLFLFFHLFNGFWLILILAPETWGDSCPVTPGPVRFWIYRIFSFWLEKS
jgi:hypothetical protein